MRLKTYFEEFFGANLACDPIQQTLGLKIQFKNCVDFSAYMRMRLNENGRTYHQPQLIDLAEEFGIIAFENAQVSGTPDTTLSGNSSKGLATQDIFHRDFINTATLLYKPAGQRRNLPTDYAMATNVRQAINRLDRTGLSEEVFEALDIMQSPDYSFASNGEELEPSITVQYGMPEFGERVFDLIPEDKKLRKSWASEKPEVVIHSNRPHHIVHGRVTGEGCSNILRGIIIRL